MARTGRKSLKEEIQVVRRMAELSEPTFKFVKECLESEDKSDKKWATEQMMKLYLRAIPQEIIGDPENPIMFLPATLMDKYGIKHDTGDSSKEPGEVSGDMLGPEMGQDDVSSAGNGQQSGEQSEPEGVLHSPDVSAGEGYRMGATAQDDTASSLEDQRVAA